MAIEILMWLRNAFAQCYFIGWVENMHIKPFGELPFSFEAQVGGQNKSNYRLRVMYVLGWIEMKMQNCSIVAIQVSLYLQLLGSFLLLKL